VSVRFETTSGTAVSGVDYVVTSDRVTFGDGETLKPVPITLVNSAVPRLQRYFTVQLMNDTTGGAVIGTPSTSSIIIDETLDAHGIFGRTLEFWNLSSVFLYI
jgi:Calx-beta domain